MWSAKGWMTREVARQWADQVWAPWRKEHLQEPAALLVMDNLDAQRTRSFQRCLEQAKTTLHHGEADATHVWQAIDRHIGASHKRLFRQVQEEWLMDRRNWQRFPKLQAWERRVLFVSWTGEARRRYLKDHQEAHHNCMACAGMQIDLQGEGDEKITVEANPLFAVQPFRKWQGLEEQVRSTIVEDMEEQEPEEKEPTPGSSPDSSSGSGTSSSSGEEEDGGGEGSSSSSSGSSSSSSDSSGSEEEARTTQQRRSLTPHAPHGQPQRQTTNTNTLSNTLGRRQTAQRLRRIPFRRQRRARPGCQVRKTFGVVERRRKQSQNTFWPGGWRRAAQQRRRRFGAAGRPAQRR